MKKLFLFFSMALLTLLAVAQSSMTDKQVLDYVKQGISAGKSQKSLMQELLSRGVDRSQALRVRKLYEQQQAGGEGLFAGQTNGTETDSRAHTVNPNSKVTTSPEPESARGGSDEVYGHALFRNEKLSFAPSATMPTPKNYILGAGDEVIVDIFGASQSTIRSTISPEGSINVNVLGPVYLAGKTVAEANTYLKKRLSTIYGGLDNGENDTDIQLSLGQIRSIQVTIMGEVPNPGTYLVSSLSTVLHAMFTAGGVMPTGSLRAIKVVRGNRTVSTVDVYEFLTTGSRKDDVRLEEGDVILVEPYQQIVKLQGLVKRPMNFELKHGETISDLLRFAGGFKHDAFASSITVIRHTGRDFEVHTVEAQNFKSFALQDGDEIQVSKMEARFENRVMLAGAVRLPGAFELGEAQTIRQLIAKGGGLQPDAFTERAVLHRENDDRSRESMGIDIDGILKGLKSDVVLRKNDSLYVSSVYELKDYGTLIIRGEVAVPDTFLYAANTTIQDLIMQAGGLLRSASLVRIDVDRMVTDNDSYVAKSEIAEHYTFTMKDGYSFDGADTFVLEPYDVVTVRRSPSYVESKNVYVTGEANFPGTYNLNKREDRVSDLVARAGDLTDFAYVKGAHISRRMTAAEQELAMSAIRSMVENGDTLTPTLNYRYSVALDLEKALKNPGSEYDIVLREGDELNIPVYDNTVHIAGAVQMQTSVTYDKSLTKKKLVDMAGGYLKRACKRKVFVVYMNGRVARLKRNTPIEPGCQVFVPMKEKKDGSANLQTTLSIATTTSSIGMMAASIANVLK